MCTDAGERERDGGITLRSVLRGMRMLVSCFMLASPSRHVPNISSQLGGSRSRLWESGRSACRRNSSLRSPCGWPNSETPRRCT